MRAKLRKVLPTSLKVATKECKREVKDILKGYAFSFAKKGTKVEASFFCQIEKTQPLKLNDFSDAKKHNIAKAIKAIEAVVIAPNTIFSFWKVVGKLSKKRGFKDGITIIDGNLTTTPGGGICQVTGLIYHACLEAGLEILERHNHSVDLYTNETRYTPLGSDATVVYGYKDLRIRNNFDFPIKFSFKIKDEVLSIQLESPVHIKKNKVFFEQKKHFLDKTIAVTYVNNQEITTSIYKNLNIL